MNVPGDRRPLCFPAVKTGSKYIFLNMKHLLQKVYKPDNVRLNSPAHCLVLDIPLDPVALPRLLSLGVPGETAAGTKHLGQTEMNEHKHKTINYSSSEGYSFSSYFKMED